MEKEGRKREKIKRKIGGEGNQEEKEERGNKGYMGVGKKERNKKVKK